MLNVDNILEKMDLPQVLTVPVLYYVEDNFKKMDIPHEPTVLATAQVLY